MRQIVAERGVREIVIAAKACWRRGRPNVERGEP
jgi:hypothetical protein